MDIKALIEAFYSLLKDFLALIGLEDKLDEIEGDIDYIFGDKAE